MFLFLHGQTKRGTRVTGRGTSRDSVQGSPRDVYGRTRVLLGVASPEVSGRFVPFASIDPSGGGPLNHGG